MYVVISMQVYFIENVNIFCFLLIVYGLMFMWFNFMNDVFGKKKDNFIKLYKSYQY